MSTRRNYSVDTTEVSRDYDYNCERRCDDDTTTELSHTHEFVGVVRQANVGNANSTLHSHRVAGVTSATIEIDNGKNHVHAYHVNTDTLEHWHEIGGKTGPAIYIGNTDKHIHVLCGTSTEANDHSHEYFFTSLIDRPLVEEETRRRSK
ncbi:YmaF family protein [Alloiococcus sp. CFN-8]|uniref:YmaF family protein n=1 Tax=Alloiococcus sp. CFN-8 TaxID=3416081 RepID=UPI003CED49E8